MESKVKVNFNIEYVKDETIVYTRIIKVDGVVRGVAAFHRTAKNDIKWITYNGNWFRDTTTLENHLFENRGYRSYTEYVDEILK